MNTADTKPCIEDNEHRATQRHTALECPTNDDLREALSTVGIVKVTDLKHDQRISLGTFGSVQVVGSVHCVYPFKKARFAVLAANGIILLEVPSATMVEVQEEVSA